MSVNVHYSIYERKNGKEFIFIFLGYMYGKRSFSTSLQHLFNEREANNKAVLDFSAPTLTMPLLTNHISGHIHANPPIKRTAFIFINNFSKCIGPVRAVPYLARSGHRAKADFYGHSDRRA
jgi:hypothetical protein